MKLKKIFLIAIILLVTKNHSQITTTTIEVRNKVKEQKIYDGKSDFEVFQNDIEDYKQYIGQKIYTTKSYSTILLSNGNTYENYKNKYFTIKDVIISKDKFYKNAYDVIVEKPVTATLELINDENGETCYYPLDQIKDNNRSKKFILVPYFLNQKKTYENKKYVMVSYWRKDGFINEATKEWVTIDKNLYGGEWNCEVSLVKGDFDEEITYIMKSNLGEIISSETIDGSSPGKFRIVNKLDTFVEGGLFFMSIEDYNNQVASYSKEKKDAVSKNNNRIVKLTQKYGKVNAVLIAKGKVEIGMSKEMCKESWGIPLKNNVEKTKTNTKEIFIYGWSKRLYFENGKLVKIEY